MIHMKCGKWECTTVIVETPHGVLIRTTKEVDASEKGSNTMTKQEMPSNGVKFFPYKSTGAVKVGQRLILPPMNSIGETILEMENQPYWSMQLKDKANKLHEATVQSIKQQIEDQEKLLVPLKRTTVRASLTYLWWIPPAITGLIVLGAIIMIASLCYKKYATVPGVENSTELRTKTEQRQEAYQLLEQQVTAYKQRRASTGSIASKTTKL